MTAPALRLDTDAIRHQLLVLRQQEHITRADMAALLFDVNERRLFAIWGHASFAAYLIYELELAPRHGYEACEVYRAYSPAWLQARAISWSRLLEALPLIKQGGWKAEELVEQLAQPTATLRAIRQWKAATLKIGDPRVEPAGAARIAKVITGMREDEPDVIIHPDMELVDYWTTDKTTWVKVTMSLPQSVLLLLVETCDLARGRLGIERAPEDDRWTLPRELEALCQEVAVEWRAAQEEEDRR